MASTRDWPDDAPFIRETDESKLWSATKEDLLSDSSLQFTLAQIENLKKQVSGIKERFQKVSSQLEELNSKKYVGTVMQGKAPGLIVKWTELTREFDSAIVESRRTCRKALNLINDFCGPVQTYMRANDKSAGWTELLKHKQFLQDRAKREEANADGLRKQFKNLTENFAQFKYTIDSCINDAPKSIERYNREINDIRRRVDGLDDEIRDLLLKDDGSILGWKPSGAMITLALLIGPAFTRGLLRPTMESKTNSSAEEFVRVSERRAALKTEIKGIRSKKRAEKKAGELVRCVKPPLSAISSFVSAIVGVWDSIFIDIDRFIDNRDYLLHAEAMFESRLEDTSTVYRRVKEVLEKYDFAMQGLAVLNEPQPTTGRHWFRFRFRSEDEPDSDMDADD